MSAADIPITPLSEIKKRKSASEAYRGAYETPNPHENTGFSRRSRKIQRAEITPEFAVIDFQAEPITTAIATIPSRKMSTVKKVSNRCHHSKKLTHLQGFHPEK
jgi:hypothetical protein